MCKSFAKVHGSHVARTTSWLPIWRTRAGPPSSSNPWHKQYAKSRDKQIAHDKHQANRPGSASWSQTVHWHLRGLFGKHRSYRNSVSSPCGLQTDQLTTWNFRDISWLTQRTLTGRVFELVHNLDSTANSKSNFRENYARKDWPFPAAKAATMSVKSAYLLIMDCASSQFPTFKANCLRCQWQGTLITNNYNYLQLLYLLLHLISHLIITYHYSNSFLDLTSATGLFLQRARHESFKWLRFKRRNN